MKQPQRRFILDIKNHFLTESVVKLEQTVQESSGVESPSLEVFKKCEDVALRDMV